MTYEQLLTCNKFGGDPRIYEAIKKQFAICLKQSKSSSSDDDPARTGTQRQEQAKQLQVKKYDSSDSSGSYESN